MGGFASVEHFSLFFFFFSLSRFEIIEKNGIKVYNTLYRNRNPFLYRKDALN